MNPYEFKIILTLTIIQSVLTHPRLASKTNKKMRRMIGPITTIWWLTYPFRKPLPAIQDRMFRGFLASTIAFKCLDWSFSNHTYYLRKVSLINNGNDSGTPTPVFRNLKSPPSPPSEDSKDNSNHLDLPGLIVWIVSSFTSQRGLRWSWGPSGKGNTATLPEAIIELIRLQLVMLPCLFFLVSSQDREKQRVDAIQGLRVLGISYDFKGIGVIAECIHTFCMGILMTSGIEMAYLMRVILLSYLLHAITKKIKKKLNIPISFIDSLDPINYPPQFGPLFFFDSVSYFWSKSWHQMLRRPLIFCALNPATHLARYIGASPKVQKMLGVVAAFSLSGILHEYLLYVHYQPPHPNPRIFTKTFPSTFIFFFLQSIGVILDETMGRLIPKRLGGNKLWTLSFLLLTGPLFTHDFGKPGGILFNVKPLSTWTWSEFFVPLPLKYQNSSSSEDL